MSERVGGIYYDVTLDTSKMVDGQREVDRRTKAVELSFNKMAAAISGAISAIAIEGLISKVITAQRQFDVLFSSLKTVTGGTEQAGAAFDRLQKFAEKTPYTLDQAVNGFVKLKALGLAPTERAMTSFGNTAAAMGKNLTQMIEAVADASTGEFERLKEFGIKARVEGDKVALTFRGTTTKIANDANSIVEYLTKIGETDFAGAMAERMNTLDGNISNLEDSLVSLYRTISAAGIGDAVASGVRKATEIIQQMEISLKEGGLTEYFDKLKPYIAAAELAVVALAGAITSRLIGAFVAAAAQAYASATAVGVATVAARGFTAVMATLGGPVGIAITALALLAIEWGKVGGQARDAAGIAEEAADRIAKALKKSQGRATVDLTAQLAEVRSEITGIDKELGNTKFPLADPKQLDELRARKGQLVGIASDIQAALDKLHGGAGRGKVNPEAVTPDAPGTPKKPKDPKFDSEAYLAGLESKTLEGMARIDAMEQEALRRNAALLKEGKITRAEAALASTSIENAAAQERLDIQLRNAEAIRSAIEEGGKQEQDLLRKQAEDRAKGQTFAQGLIVAADPVAQLQLELQAKSALLAEYAAIDQANAELYAQAKVELERETAERMTEIVRKQRAEQDALNSALLTNYGSLFGSMADLMKAFGGEQSSAYRAMFAVSKAFAIADSIIKIQQGIAAAASLPFPANLGAMATVAAQTVGIISTIKGTNYGGGRQYGGPVSSDSMYRVNEGGRPEMFTAANGAQYMMPTSDGRVSPAGDGAGGGWTININEAPPGTTATVNQEARIIDISVGRAKAEIAAEIGSNSGQVWSAFRASTNVQGKM